MRSSGNVLRHDAIQFSIAFEWHKTTETCRLHIQHSKQHIANCSWTKQKKKKEKKDLNEIRSMAFTCLLALNVRCIKGQVEMRECSVKRKIHYYWNTVCIRSNDAMCHISRWPYAIRSLPFMCNAVFGICNFHMKMALCSYPCLAHSISFGSSWAR